MDNAELRTEIEQQKALMVAVATGGPRIDDKQREYVRRRQNIGEELRRRGFPDPNPHRDLWSWYGHWSANFGSYYERRVYVNELYESLLDALDHLDERHLGTDLEPAETGWVRVDDQLGQLRERYAVARTEEDFQAIGLLCRDLFRSLSEATFEDSHVPARAATPGPADSVARLHLVVDAYAPGEGNREIRKVTKATFDLANKANTTETRR
jgi:hypothetical protein